MNIMLPPPPRRSAGHAPLRRAGSVRRTSSIDVSWPRGRNEVSQLNARARDVVTPLSGGAPIVRADDTFEASLKRDRTIAAIKAEPDRPALSRLVGERGGGGLRKILGAAIPEEFAGATPLYLLLDDLSGASLVSGWAWSQWDPDWLAGMRKAAEDPVLSKAFPDRAGICAGFTPGSSGLSVETDRSGTPAGSLVHPDDPEGWHLLPLQEGPGMRRARRIDIWRDDVIHIDSAFQDSATTPAGGRAAVHEYSLIATADPVSMRLLTIEARPYVLPFAECPAAAASPSKLLGTPLGELRTKVLAELRGTVGCTHLNDALRALAETPALLRLLEKAV